MPKYIYELTLFDGTKYISSKLNKLSDDFNKYCIDNQIYTLNKNERVIMSLTGHNLSERASGRINSTYPLKSVEKHHCHDYFKEEMLERFPTSFNNEPLRCYYVRKLCKEKGL